MVKIAVCDDEKNIRDYLVSLIRKQGIECSIAEYASANEYLADGKEHDMVFLDIELGGSGAEPDGMGLARHIRGMDADRQPVIIFVTGYEKYVYDAFDVGAFQYLVKPVDEQKFAEVFGRAAGQILSEKERRKKKLVIQYAGEGRIIPLDDIYYMESQNHNIVLFQKSGKLEYYGKIGDLEEELAGQFYRIHRGYLVNLFHVEGYNKTEVRMANGDKLMLSRYKYDGFVQAYMDYISEEGL
ncbi:MAG: LytTR family DNA-binding domain-containing protein [Lachnospiraceae bacterium]|nr:LytTR family DNA-binding domain-containing protein [Butyrivibrio sp.]MCM1345174.1 LytTR family DNA-binding domain-containing protein [Muribaculaceae bacterium]MCM1412380.1 LytTR family DNA-binding domain-containing protein [Lachnospiraceae bacterium]MCM1543064.1 LytTR family DNA-binding domain-containing protein [Blautia sp.]